jgi:hypothetical protein
MYVGKDVTDSINYYGIAQALPVVLHILKASKD